MKHCTRTFELVGVSQPGFGRRSEVLARDFALEVVAGLRDQPATQRRLAGGEFGKLIVRDTAGNLISVQTAG